MKAQAIRSLRQARRTIDRHGLTSAATVDDVLTAVEAHRRRAVNLEVLPEGVAPVGVFGMWLALPDHDIVLYRVGASSRHEDHSILHELGHALMNHHDSVGTPSNHAQRSAAMLFPDLPPSLIRKALERCAYDSTQEQDAEVFAMEMGRNLRRVRQRQDSSVLAVLLG